MERHYQIHIGDCLETLRTLTDNSVDSIVTDPPYGLSKEPDMAEVLRHWLAGDDYQHKGGGFMGKSWDSFVPGPSVWRECLRVLKPGGHLLAFFGTRTQDMGTLAIRLAGFEIRDSIAWVYGSGFPKSLNVAKAIESGGGRPEDIRRMQMGDDYQPSGRGRVNYDHGAGSAMGAGVAEWWPATDAARQWEGWGTALKPALEPITVARKPLVGTVAANVLAHGTGALNIDGCRVAPTGERLGGGDESGKASKPEGWARPWMDDPGHVAAHNAKVTANVEKATELGRWPANLIHDGSDEVVALFPANAGASAPVKGTEASKASVGNVTGERERVPGAFHADNGSAARFFYCAKASRKDRNEGLQDPGPQFKHGATLRKVENTATAGNNHPTVKPTDLMRYLCRLVTPPGGVVDRKSVV